MLVPLFLYSLGSGSFDLSTLALAILASAQGLHVLGVDVKTLVADQGVDNRIEAHAWGSEVSWR